jgi:hypothetical protein
VGQDERRCEFFDMADRAQALFHGVPAV